MQNIVKIRQKKAQQMSQRQQPQPTEEIQSQ
jgi:hypothetical protein